jgi:L-iditol 2-dehydrogenase
MSAVEQAWKSVEKGGSIVFFAVPGPEKAVSIPVNDFWTKEIRVLTSYYCGPLDIKEAMAQLAEKKIEVNSLVTHRLPIEEIAKGFSLMAEGTEAVKVIIEPNGLTES